MKTTLLSISVAVLCCSCVQGAIKDIRWGSSGGPLTGLTITWSNSISKDSIKWGYNNTFEQGTFPAASRAGNGGGFFLKYVIASASPSSTIYYKLFDSSNNTWGSQKTFKTAPPANTTAFSFLAMGDSRSGMSVWNQVSTLANSKAADFTIFNGDVVNSGSSLSDWTNWFSNGSQFINNNLIYHSMGNHETSSVPYYQNTFDLPQTNGSNLYYSFTYGDAVFICLNSESPSSTTQYNWLVSTLQANQTKKWKIVFFHRPFYTIGSHAGEMNSYYSTWWKAFDDYGVDIICNGHDHMYERTKPLNRNVSTTAPVATYGSGPQDGRCQIVCGGAGAPLYSGSSSWFIQKYQSKYNFCKFDVNGCKITCTVYDNNNAVIETFTLDKCATGITDAVNKFNKITIAPNPVEGMFTMNYQSAETGKGTIRIYDLSGRTVLSEQIDKTTEEIRYSRDLSGFPAGVYNLEIIVGTQKDDALIIIK